MRAIWRAEEAQTWMRQLIIDAMVGEGKSAADRARARTPVFTGYARRSVYWCVVDEQGRIIAGDRRDGNGRSVVVSRSGRLQLIVGSGADYFVWIEVGSRGRPGKHILTRTMNEASRNVIAGVNRRLR